MSDSIPCIPVSAVSLSHLNLNSNQNQSSVRDYFTSSKTGNSNSNSSGSSTSQKAAMPSSIPFEVPSSVTYLSSSSNNSPSSRSTGSSGRGKKRERHQSENISTDEAQTEETTTESMETDELVIQSGIVRTTSEVRSLPPSPSNSSASAPRLSVSKLSNRTLLYQLHVLRSDELMLLRAVDGGGVEMQLSNDLTEQALVKRAAQVEQKAAADSLAEQKDTVKLFGGGSSLVTDGGMVLDWQTSGSSSVPIQEPHNASEQSEALASPTSIQSSPSPAPALASHPLFPDPLDYVTLYTSTTAAHNAFLKIQKEWARKGVTNVKERIIEFQLTTPARLLVIGTPLQRTHWIDASTSTSATASFSSHEDSMMTASESLPVIRASPFHKPPRRSAAAASSQQTIAPTHLVVSTAISGKDAAFPTFPALYSNPHISPALRTVLDRNEGEIEGFCATRQNAASEAELEGMDLTEVVLMDGEITLRASSCSTCLHVLDDDKKHRVTQQLLTDLFQKMNVGRKNAPSASSSSSSAASMMMMTDHLSTSSSSLPLSSASASSASSSSFSSNWNHSTPGTFQLAPSSFSSSLQAASAHMFAGNGISLPSSQ